MNRYSIYLIILLLGLCTISSKAQIILDPIEWYIYEESESGAPVFTLYSTSQIVSINDTQYYRLSKEGMATNCYFRYEQGKFIRYDVTKEIEKTLCDFGLDKGNVFENADGESWVVEQVSDTVLIQPNGLENSPVRVLTLHCLDNPEKRDVWIERVGSAFTGPFFRSEMEGKENSQQIVWWNNQADRSLYVSSINNEKVKTGLMNIIPLEGEDTEFSDSLVCELSGDSLIVSGRKVLVGSCDFPYLQCSLSSDTISFAVNTRIGPNRSSVDVLYFRNAFAGFESGNYLFRYRNWKGEFVENKVVPKENKLFTVGAASYTLCVSCEDGSQAYCQLTAGKDSVSTFDGKEYMKYQIRTPGENYMMLTYNWYFRQDGDRIYRYDENAGKEILAFDFSLKEGDVFEAPDGNRWRVDQTGDTTFVQDWDGKKKGPFRMLSLTSIDNPRIHDEWMEGIGSLRTGLLTGRDVADVVVNDHRGAAHKADEIKTLMIAETPSCHHHWDIDTGGMKGRFLKPSLAVCDYSRFILAGHELGYEFVGDKLHVAGKPQILLSYYIYLVCYVEDGKIDIDYISEPYTAGAWGVTDYGIDTYFGGFEPGSYSISYVGNKINYRWDDLVVLECGKPLKGDVNEDGVVDINDVTSVINIMAGQ